MPRPRVRPHGRTLAGFAALVAASPARFCTARALMDHFAPDGESTATFPWPTWRAYVAAVAAFLRDGDAGYHEAADFYALRHACPPFGERVFTRWGLAGPPEGWRCPQRARRWPPEEWDETWTAEAVAAMDREDTRALLRLLK